MGLSKEESLRLSRLRFDDFRRMANDESLSANEKIGFPDSYRKGKAGVIFHNILGNLPLLMDRERVVLEVGPGCGELPRLMIDLCAERDHKLLLVDSEEMLGLLPERDFVRKFAACYPQCEALFSSYLSKVDVLLSYSVAHTVFIEGNIWDFLDRSLELLAEGGQMLIGDVPNSSKRRRFLSSANGVKFHQRFMGTRTLPEVHFNQVERHEIDDSVILGLISRARNQGFDAYLLPQSPGLPFENRREDILIRRP